MIKLYKEKNIFKVLELKTCDCCLVPMSHFLCALLYDWGYIKKKMGEALNVAGVSCFYIYQRVGQNYVVFLILLDI